MKTLLWKCMEGDVMSAVEKILKRHEAVMELAFRALVRIPITNMQERELGERAAEALRRALAELREGEK